MNDENFALENRLSNAGEYDTAIAVKLLAGWVQTGEDCETCMTQLICNRMNQAYCVACSEWRKTPSNSIDKKVKIPKTKPETTTLLLGDDDTPSFIRVIKASPGQKANIGKKLKDIHMEKSNLEVNVRSPKESARQRSTLQQNLFCSVPPIVDDDSGPINAALWEECSRYERNFRRNDMKCEAARGSPRAVLEGPESSGWSESTSRKSLLSLSFTDEVEDDHTGLAQSSQNHCMQSLWRLFAIQKWQAFPSSSKKKELRISDPVLITSSGRSDEEEPHLGPSDHESVHDLLGVSCNAKRSWQTFSYEDISLATNNFDSEHLVGKGGYAKVFKGVLKNGQLIAVKKHNRGVTAAEKERDFLTELGIVSHVAHTNVAKLLGICIENGLHLVFQFCTLGSLQSLLQFWKASALHASVLRFYVSNMVHYSCGIQISDFGLSKWLPERWMHHTVAPIEGTFGYLAPEYFMYGIVDEKTDVFAYGVLLLELITGRRPVDSKKQNLVAWAKPHLNKCNMKELADLRLDSAFDAGQMQRVVLTAGLCVRSSAHWRPSMSQVLQLLTEEGAENESEDLSRLVSRPHDFIPSDTESQDYGYSDSYESDMQRHRALALNSE
ncbi:receptor-like cytosolic serine/threonine-protein kinase RBK1 isoform X5 [Physcomitrium patens]|uniref:receptor-like cytosolic serine/threonine-protein kinase RBK1 isoform X5 n=1 Tax=Physcomitrium patens TaxID=3218 RepID=UPI000D156A3F|nr:receptor-like cytosolic serine/threonine-protein kinase RBK1 isoform X6 [Physcomitrium patens]|eukprot:XP_024382718.1 receptor-like cytosolic serine/threonine-protein kinase RBK1 isoform X6 [Physcomitrella patens]